VDNASEIKEKVTIGTDTIVIGSIIHGPVYIGNNCNIKKAYIGPYTCIGDGTIIEESSIEHSVILDNCSINRIDRLQDSLIGTGVKVLKGNQQSKAIKLFVGDDAVVEV